MADYRDPKVTKDQDKKSSMTKWVGAAVAAIVVLLLIWWLWPDDEAAIEAEAPAAGIEEGGGAVE